MSTRKEMLALVRKLINDEQATGFTEGGNLEQPEGTQELLNYLDRAVDTYSKQRASAHDPLFLKKIVIGSGVNVPDDFLAFAGNVPCEIDSGHLNWYGPSSDLNVRYYARLPYVSSYSETATLPYEHDQYMKIAALAAIYALNKHEFNVSQDLQLLALSGESHGIS